jgi:metal-responsive CopG/Arc/MetJ family transcriptional regulator
MIRKQLYIEEDLDRQLKRLARVSGRSEAEHVREALRSYLDDRLPQPSEDPWLGLVGMVGEADGPGDAAVNHDHYLYGAPKRSA